MKRSTGYYVIQRNKKREPAFYGATINEWYITGSQGPIDESEIEVIGDRITLPPIQDKFTKPITLFGDAV